MRRLSKFLRSSKLLSSTSASAPPAKMKHYHEKTLAENWIYSDAGVGN